MKKLPPGFVASREPRPLTDEEREVVAKRDAKLADALARLERKHSHRPSRHTDPAPKRRSNNGWTAR